MQLPEEVRRFLEESALAALCFPVDLGAGAEAVLVVKAAGDLIGALREVDAPVETGWVVEGTSRGPVVCLAVRATAPDVGELLAEVYFDVLDPADEQLLQSLASQEGLRTVFLDEEMAVAWAPRLAWSEVRRLEADQVRDRAEEFAERCEECDFGAARELFQEAVALAGLEARAFGG